MTYWTIEAVQSAPKPPRFKPAYDTLYECMSACRSYLIKAGAVGVANDFATGDVWAYDEDAKRLPYRLRVIKHIRLV